MNIIQLAENRIRQNDPSKNISFESIVEESGFTMDELLTSIDDVEIEYEDE